MLADDRNVGRVERLFQLRKAPMIGTLEPHLLAPVADAMRPRVFRRGEALVREGERPTASHYLIEGRLHVERAGRLLGHAEAGSALGGMGILARLPAPVTASAESDVLTLELDADTLFDLLEDHFDIIRHLLREVTGRIIDAWRRLPGTSPPFRAERPIGIVGTRDLDLVERIFFLRSVTPFQHASINALAELGRSLWEVHFEPGEPLWSEGEPARHVVLLVSGAAACSARDGFTLNARPGTSLGALEAIAGRHRWYDAEVTAPLTGLSGEVEVLFDVFEDNLDMALHFLAAMSRWMLTLSESFAETAPEQLGTVGGLDLTPFDPSAEEADGVAAAQNVKPPLK